MRTTARATTIPKVGRRSLQPTGVEAAPLIRDVLGDVRDGAAILAAQAQALNHPQTEQEERGGYADLIEGGDQPDHPGADTHSAQRDEKRVLPPYSVAQPSEQERAQRTDQESGGEERDRTQQSRDRVRLLEEFDRQHGGQAPEDIEVIPFDDVSHRRGNNHAPEILRDLHCLLLPCQALSLGAADAPKIHPTPRSETFPIFTAVLETRLFRSVLQNDEKGIIAGDGT